MSTVDYGQKVEDHGTLLILVKQVGCHLRPKGFSQMYERITRVTSVHIHGQNRTVFLRYKKTYPRECNEWGDFQAHRKVLGLICVGKCDNENEVPELFKLYEDLQQAYDETLYDSRLILFGLNKDGTLVEEEQRLRKLSESDSGITDVDLTSLTSEDKENSNVVHLNQTGGRRQGGGGGGGSHGNRTSSQSADKTHFQDPLNVNVIDNSPSTSPEDEEEEEDDDGDGLSFSSPKHSPTHALPKKLNTNAKQVALETNSGEATETNSVAKDAASPHVLCYPSEEQCHDLDDKIQDFIASLFWVLESKRLDRSHEKQDRPVLLTTPFDKKDLVGVDTDSRTYKRRCQGRLRKHLGDLCLLAGLPAESMVHYQTAMDILRNSVDWFWLGGCYEGSCAATVLMAQPAVDKSTLQRNLSFSTQRGTSAMKEATKGLRSATFGVRSMSNGLDLDDTRGRQAFPVDDVIEKYREAILQYAKFKPAGMLEMEASLKACRVVLGHQRYLAAADFLQNVVYINIHVHEDEKIQRFNTLAGLYEQIGMKRKAAFFRRISAMQCVAPTNPKPGWQQCYNLLLQALEGFKLSLDPKDIPQDQQFGWPLVQIRVLHELIYSSRRMGNPAIAVRHLTFLLHTMFDHLSSAERQELATVLQSYTVRCEGTPQSLALDNGVILPPVPLLKFPTVRSFKPVQLAPHLRPVRLKSLEPGTETPPSARLFIYSPLQRNNAQKAQAIADADILWVEGDPCEVTLQSINPMALELKLTNMGLLTEGAVFETYPTSLSLPAASGPYQVKIMGTPKEAGKLTILGYTTRALGVRSHCRLRDLAQVGADKYEVMVVPALPQLQVATSLPKAASFSSLSESETVVTSATASLYAGQRCECQVTLTNTSRVPVEHVEMTLDSRLDKGLLQELLHWNQNNLSSQLPIQPGAQACLTIYIHSVADFVVPARLRCIEESYTSRLQCPRKWTASAEDLTSDSNPVILEALLKVQYTGRRGLSEGFCRQCSVTINVELQPSVLIHAWDLLPSLSCDRCQLLLELENVTPHPVQMLCSCSSASNLPEQTFSIESSTSYRCAIEIPKCNISPDDPAPDGTLTSDVAGAPSESDSLIHSKESGSGDSAATCWLQRMLTQHITEVVDVRWRIPSEEPCEGDVSLDKLWWTPQQLSLLQRSQVRCVLSVNSQSCEGLEEPITCSCGELVSLQYEILNHSEVCLCEVLVELQCYQDQGSGALVTCLGSDQDNQEQNPDHDQDQDQQEVEEQDQEQLGLGSVGSIICIGTKSNSVQQISPSSSHSGHCQLIFLAPGVYKLSLACEGLRRTTPVDPRYTDIPFIDGDPTAEPQTSTSRPETTGQRSTQVPQSQKELDQKTSSRFWLQKVPVTIVVEGSSSM